MKSKITKIMMKPSWFFLKFLDKVAFIFPDKLFLKIKYYLIMKKRLNLKSPKTFNEKLQWLKLHAINTEYTQIVDKMEAKKYVSSIIGEKYIIPTLGIYDKFEHINFDELPNQFVLKCTHDSGGYVICSDKKSFDFNSAKIKLNNHLKINPYYSTREFPYKNVKPRIIAEKFIIDKKNQVLLDYKFMVFQGKVKNIFVCSDRNTNTDMKMDFFDENWNHLPFERYYSNSKLTIQKPVLLIEMKQLSELLASKINAPFVRVDLYQVNNQIYFGEITFYPGGGWECFSPEEWDYTFGSWINLSSTNLTANV